VSDLRIQPGTPLTRNIVTPFDAQQELFAKGLLLRSRMQLLALTTQANLSELNPPPAVGDVVIAQIAGGNTAYLYIQLSVRPRLRLRLGPGTLELA